MGMAHLRPVLEYLGRVLFANMDGCDLARRVDTVGLGERRREGGEPDAAGPRVSANSSVWFLPEPSVELSVPSTCQASEMINRTLRAVDHLGGLREVDGIPVVHFRFVPKPRGADNMSAPKNSFLFQGGRHSLVGRCCDF